MEAVFRITPPAPAPHERDHGSGQPHRGHYVEVPEVLPLRVGRLHDGLAASIEKMRTWCIRSWIARGAFR
jgi:hypothetical protein